MCIKFNKPTGKPGAANDLILCCQRVQLQRMKENASSMMGGDGFFPNKSSSTGEEDGKVDWLREENDK